MINGKYIFIVFSMVVMWKMFDFIVIEKHHRVVDRILVWCTGTLFLCFLINIFQFITTNNHLYNK